MSRARAAECCRVASAVVFVLRARRRGNQEQTSRVSVVVEPLRRRRQTNNRMAAVVPPLTCHPHHQRVSNGTKMTDLTDVSCVRIVDPSLSFALCAFFLTSFKLNVNNFPRAVKPALLTEALVIAQHLKAQSPASSLKSVFSSKFARFSRAREKRDDAMNQPFLCVA